MDYWFSAHQTANLAAEMESKGAAFYVYLQGVTDDATIADMCALLAEQEQEHRAKFLGISEFHRASDAEHCYSVDVCGMLQASMQALTEFLNENTAAAQKPPTVSECLSLAARLEATSVSVYSKMIEKYAAGFTTVLADGLGEERKHLQMIQHVQSRMALT